MYKFCIPPSGKGRLCYFIPILLPKWEDLFPPEPPFLRFFRPFRILLINILMGPRPSPWREAGVRVAPQVERDLTALSSMHSYAEELSPELRESVQDALRSAVQRVPVPREMAIQA